MGRMMKKILVILMTLMILGLPLVSVIADMHANNI